jgi:hypothetical protein
MVGEAAEGEGEGEERGEDEAVIGDTLLGTLLS